MNRSGYSSKQLAPKGLVAVDMIGPLWKQRFRLCMYPGAQIADAHPTRGVVLSNRRSDTLQLYAWDLSRGELRPLQTPKGVINAWISPDGKYVYYLNDQKGNESGHIVRVPFEGGELDDITPNMPPYSLRGFHISLTGNMLAFMAVNRDGFQLFCVVLGPENETGIPQLIYKSKHEVWGSMLSANGDIVATKSTEKARGARCYNLLAFDTATTRLIGELWGGRENSVEPMAFSPITDDCRLLAITTATGYERPLIWQPRTNERLHLELSDLEGPLIPLLWSPDGEKFLLKHFERAVQKIYLYNLVDKTLTKLNHPGGVFHSVLDGVLGGGGLSFMPTGEILANWQDSTHPPQLIALDGKKGCKFRTVLSAGEVPISHVLRCITFISSDGEKIQGWLGVPEGEGPFPTILETHGGPHCLASEIFDPRAQAWLDHGFAYLTINYRGSIMFGRNFQQKIWNNIGCWELQDMVAARGWLVEQRIARPDSILLHGISYGGFLTLLGLGKRPDLWAGGIATVAIADWTMAYADASDAIKAAFCAWFWGTPEEIPEQYKTSSPMSYAKNVKAPVLIFQERHDTRTPAGQMEMFEKKMKSLRKNIIVKWFDGGHTSVFAPKQAIAMQEEMIKFACRIIN